MLPIFYRTFFPTHTMIRWLSYGRPIKNYLAYREFSFTLPGDAWVRYQSYASEADFRDALRQKVPHKIDIGPVYTVRPRDRHMYRPEACEARERELVFDIDMTDYDDVRTCCTGADMCDKCWIFMTAARDVLDDALRQDFGFKHILWVYSGRRGLHGWVCDHRARVLSADARGAVVSYLSVKLTSPAPGGSGTGGGAYGDMLARPGLRRAYRHLLHYFETALLASQGYLTDARWEATLATWLPHAPQCRAKLAAKFSQRSHSDPWDRWTLLRAAHEAGGMSGAAGETLSLPALIFFLLYPRLDAAVSRGVNHLLKSPFVVHPKTGKVCVPID
ncbi:prim-pol domain-containing protein, partial [Caulochytrium protostelioides]